MTALLFKLSSQNVYLCFMTVKLFREHIFRFKIPFYKLLICIHIYVLYDTIQCSNFSNSTVVLSFRNIWMIKIFTTTNVWEYMYIVHSKYSVNSVCVHGRLSNRFFIAIKCAYLTLFNGNARILFIIISRGGMAKRHCRNTI